VLAISLPPYGFFQVLCKFLQTQGLNNEILQASFGGVIVHAVVVYVLVFLTPLGYMGAAWATTITLLALDGILFTIIIKKYVACVLVCVPVFQQCAPSLPQSTSPRPLLSFCLSGSCT
jgi:Na+-driven multidrug efflux pump